MRRSVEIERLLCFALAKVPGFLHRISPRLINSAPCRQEWSFTACLHKPVTSAAGSRATLPVGATRCQLAFCGVLARPGCEAPGFRERETHPRLFDHRQRMPPVFAYRFPVKDCLLRKLLSVFLTEARCLH